MNVLGICDNHDAGATLISKGKIVAAINEERLNRIKCSGGFPELSILKILEIGKIKPQEIDKIVIASFFTPIAFFRLIEKHYQRNNRRISEFSYLFNLYVIYQVIVSKIKFLKFLEIAVSKKILSRKLKKMGFNCEISFVEHHTAHAYSVFNLSGFSEALIVTTDAMGDGITLTVSQGTNKEIKRIYAESGFSAISSYYARITEFLGFKHNRHEGKITALASYANPDKVLPFAHKLLHFTGDKFNKINYFIKQHKQDSFYKQLKNFSREEIAAGFQQNLEVEFSKFISYWIKKTNFSHIALAGGLFANIKLNQKIHELKEVKEIFITPHMGDGGAALGAALYATNLNLSAIETIYLGNSATKQEIEKALSQNNLSYTLYEQEQIEKKAAQLIAQGKLIGVFRGRLEFGPRALGNRSVLYQTTDPQAKEVINHRLNRTEFMPFAPATLKEYAEQCYQHLTGAEYTAKFMNISFQCTEWMKKNCPGTVHLDGTARPQLISKDDNPFFYNVINEYRKITNIPSILNTSFNLHEEPIVSTPEEAIESFLRSKLDYLILDNFLVTYPI